MAEKAVLDDALIVECQRAQQATLGYSDTRDEVWRKAVHIMDLHPEFRRDQIVDHIGKMRTPG